METKKSHAGWGWVILTVIIVILLMQLGRVDASATWAPGDTTNVLQTGDH